MPRGGCMRALRGSQGYCNIRPGQVRAQRGPDRCKGRVHAGQHRPGTQDLCLGVDFGTSGSRAVVIDGDAQVLDEQRVSFSGADNASVVSDWERALWSLLQSLSPQVRGNIRSIAVDGTSSTAILLDANSGSALAPPKLYNEAQDAQAVEAAASTAPAGHTATSSTSTLAKLLSWHLGGQIKQARAEGMQPVLLHQADWLAMLLHGKCGHTDWSNALKLGFDPGTECYPAWLTSQAFAAQLPQHVHEPGAVVGAITGAAAARAGLPEDCMVCAGATDSVAAFMAARVTQSGQAVTSLGSSLAVKLLSDQRVDDSAYGVYSHRLGKQWLVGGASNTGGAVLQQYFSSEQLRTLSGSMTPERSTGLSYYPLLKPGERFPINDPQKQPCLEPRPDDDAVFLQGMLEGIAGVEAQAYKLLADMGATPLTEVITAGGGAANEVWTKIRAQRLGVPVRASQHTEAAYGAALLALQGLRSLS